MKDAPTAKQNIEIYHQKQIWTVLEQWGEGNTWDEIQLLLTGIKGKVLDIACGTGNAMILSEKFPQIEVYGCDISPRLIHRAHQKGVPEKYLAVANATTLPYQDNFFDYSYSIGSIEHFTENDIHFFLKECKRVTKFIAFHQNPVSINEKDVGWIETSQGYFNNSTDWWLRQYKKVFPFVLVMNSKWSDTFSKSKWFVCYQQK